MYVCYYYFITGQLNLRALDYGYGGRTNGIVSAKRGKKLVIEMICILKSIAGMQAFFMHNNHIFVEGK